MANDNERRGWVNNDEGLYDEWRRSGKGITTWVRENRQRIDECSGAVTRGEKRAHYLKYGE